MKSILLVDDEKQLVESYKLLLQLRHKDAHVSTALNGQEALEKARQLDYTIIITDINMPVMDGIEFHKRLKVESPILAGRVGVLSGVLDNNHIPYLENEGCPYLAKPFDNVDFFAFVNSILSKQTDKFIEKHGYACQRKFMRFKTGETCILSDGEMSKPTITEVFDHSKNGLGIWYKGAMLPLDLKVNVLVETMNIIDRQATVVWSESVDGYSRSGLLWG